MKGGTIMAWKDSQDFRNDYPGGYSEDGDVYDGNDNRVGYVTGDGDYRINNDYSNEKTDKEVWKFSRPHYKEKKERVMKNIINVYNNNYIKIINENSTIPSECQDIIKLKLAKILKIKEIVFKIDFNKIKTEEYRTLLRKLLFIKNLSVKMKKKIGFVVDKKNIVAYIINYNENNIKHQDFISGIRAIFYNTKYERYNYIYDTVCDYLDGYFYGKNLCDFQDNKCGEKRTTSCTTGCCHHFKYKILGPFSKMVICEHINKENYTCDAKCLPCKLFTCDYLEKKGVKFKVKDILLLDTFFNQIQKYFIKYMVFTPKEKILKRLIKL